MQPGLVTIAQVKVHWKAECPMLKPKHRSQLGNHPVKPVALSAPARLSEKAEAIAAVKQLTESNAAAAHVSLPSEPVPSPGESPMFSPGESSQADEAKEVHPGYKPYVTSGFVSLGGSDKKFLLRS